MAFYSEHAPRIWEDLYTALIPDQVTQNPQYLRVFGVHQSGYAPVDKMMEDNLTMVKIPIIKMVEYFEMGVPVIIPERRYMLEIHRQIEQYLGEWYHHIRTAINSDIAQHRDMILSIEKFSKKIYDKAYAEEVVVDVTQQVSLGLRNPLEDLQKKTKVVNKPDYEGISKLVRQKTNVTRF